MCQIWAWSELPVPSCEVRRKFKMATPPSWICGSSWPKFLPRSLFTVNLKPFRLPVTPAQCRFTGENFTLGVPQFGPSLLPNTKYLGNMKQTGIHSNKRPIIFNIKRISAVHGIGPQLPYGIREKTRIFDAKIVFPGGSCPQIFCRSSWGDPLLSCKVWPKSEYFDKSLNFLGPP